MASRRAVFLDRDGVLNPLIYHREAGIVDSPFTLAQFRVLPRVARAIRRLNHLGLPVVLVSNQPGLAKGHFDSDFVAQCERKLNTALARAGAHLDASYYCLHHPAAIVRPLRRRCSCRKPAPGMLLRAAKELGLSLPGSYMVGDGLTDIEAGDRAGCRTVFVGTWKCEHGAFIRPRDLRPTFTARDLWGAVELIAHDLELSSFAAAPYHPRTNGHHRISCP